MNVINIGYRLAYNAVHPFVKPVWWLLGKDLIGVYVVVWHDGRVLAIKNSYKREYCLPGGMVDAGESPTEAGARELREEVGVHVQASDLQHVHDIVQKGGRSADHAYVVSVDWPGPQPELVIDGREVVWADFISPQELLARPLAPGLEAFLIDAAKARGLPV